MANKIKNKKVKNNKGITLIALVITIIVLLILAGISIATLTGENGLLGQAENAKTEITRAAAKEKVQLEVLGSIGQDGKLNLETLKSNLKKDLGLQDKDIKDTNGDFPLTVTVDGYEVTVDNIGNVTVGGEKTPPSSDTVVPGVKVEGSNKPYSDGTDTAMIPEGFTVSNKEGESTISTGLVVIGPDGSEFVWVPVDDINDMAQCSTPGGNCNLQLDGDHLKCITHNSMEIVGKLYVTDVGDGFGTVNITYDANSGLREPAYLIDKDNGDASSYNTIGLTLNGLQNEYKLMAESVAKYGGFYVGRYEMSLNTATSTSAGTSGTAQSKAGVIPTSGYNSATFMWYGLYDKAKTYTASSVQSSMIWGSQYDVMLNWALNGTDKDKVTTTGIGNNSSGSVTTTGNDTYSNDSINHVRDLGGNLCEWTLEAQWINMRAFRGGAYNRDYSPSERIGGGPNYDPENRSSRLTLYIQ